MANENGSPQEVKPENVTSVSLTVPIYNEKELGYLPLHVTPSLDDRQGRALKRVWMALDRSESKLLNGRPVASMADAVRYLLEQIPE